MPKPLAIPAADAPAGKKIDFLAARLARALKPRGFQRQGRTLHQRVGDGIQRHWRVINLQSGQWNSGPHGEFYVNIALQFPAVIELMAREPGQAHWLGYTDRPDEVAGQFRERLDQLARPDAPGSQDKPFDERIGPGTDLADLAARLEAAVIQTALPWFEAHGSLEALRDGPSRGISCRPHERVAAALVLGDLAGAQQLVDAHREHWDRLPERVRSERRQWLSAWPLDLSVLEGVPPPRPASAWQLRQEAAERAEAETHAAEAARLHTTLDAAAPDPAVLAAAWLSEYRSCWRSEPDVLQQLAAGRQIAALDPPRREQVLVALMHDLVAQEAQRAPEAAPWARDPFGADEFLAALVKPLTAALPACSLGTARALFAAMGALHTRFDQDLVTGHFPWPFPALVAWLDQAARSHREALKPDVQAWLDGLGSHTLRRYDGLSAAIREEDAKPLDPDGFLYDLLRTQREEREALAATLPPIDEAAVRHRIADYPEQQFGSEDKRAIGTLRRWLRRDPVTDKLPLAFDGDDWGAPAQAAWDALDPALRAALLPAMEWLADTATGKPGQRWLQALDQQRRALPAPHGDAWRAWVIDRLAAFEHTSGTTEWATTGARPGVGARLGEASAALLAGLLWWAWRDDGIETARLAPVLRSVAAAAWRMLDGVGARAPGIGALVLQMLAGCGEAERGWLASLAGRGSKKQLKRAVEAAMATPLTRG